MAGVVGFQFFLVFFLVARRDSLSRFWFADYYYWNFGFLVGHDDDNVHTMFLTLDVFLY